MSEFDYSKVMTTGSRGMLGSYVDFGLATTKDTVDILDQVAVSKYVHAHQPTAIIHLAAATNTAQCESDPAYAYLLNTVGTQNVALAAEAVGAVMVYVSTSRIFDGIKDSPYTETDVPNPTSIYAKSKYLGELTTSIIASQYIIARGCWLFGGRPEHDTKFFGNVIRQLGNKEIVALDDVYGSPTYAKDFIAAVKQLLSDGARGVYHVCNTGSATRAAIVAHMVQATGSSAVVKRVDRSYFETGALLPTNESMISSKLKLRPWQEALSEYCSEEIMQ